MNSSMGRWQKVIRRSLTLDIAMMTRICALLEEQGAGETEQGNIKISYYIKRSRF